MLEMQETRIPAPDIGESIPMRQKIRQQLSIVEPAVNHKHAAELLEMSNIIDACPEIANLVHYDLVRDLDDPESGREGMMTGEQVFKTMNIKQMNGFSYEELSFHIADSKSYRAFCGFGIGDDTPSASTLQRDFKKVRPETLEEINRIIVKYAAGKGIEKGRKTRTDCTTVETNIHHPTDSSLLEDSVRTVARLVGRAVEVFGLDINFVDHSRRAKKRALEILNAKSTKRQKKPYKDLLQVAGQTVGYAEEAVRSLEVVAAVGSVSLSGIEEAAENAADELRHFIELAEQVISQTERRMLHGESVPSAEKVFSIFEPHTDIIVKDRRDPVFGHKIVLTGGGSGLFIDLVIEEGNPADSTLAEKMISRQKDIYDRVPLQVAFDGGFASKLNLEKIKDMGVKDVSFHKKRGLDVSEMVKSAWVYKKLRNFRAGVEGMISFIKRCFGLGRCNWRGWESFKSYAWSSVVTANLLLMARHALA